MNIFFLYIIPFALILDKVLGEAPNRFHPVALLGSMAIKVEAFVRSIGRVLVKRLFLQDKNINQMETTKEKLLSNSKAFEQTKAYKILYFCLGMLATLLVVLIALLPYFLYLFLVFCLFPFIEGIFLVNSPFSILSLVENLILFLYTSFVVYLCLAPSSLAEHALVVAKAMQKESIREARKAVSAIVGRNTEKMDFHAVGRACVESISENVTDGVFSTLFWASVGLIFLGYEGAIFFVCLHRAINTLDAMWGKRNEKYRNFGTFAARLDDILNYFPARLGFLAIVGASFFMSGASGKKAYIIGYRYRYFHASPNSAWSEAAFAGALGLKLGGPVFYGDFYQDYPYFGEGTEKVEVKDVFLAIRLMWYSVLFFTLFCFFVLGFVHLVLA